MDVSHLGSAEIKALPKKLERLKCRLAREIKNLMREQGFSRDQLSALTGISPSLIQNAVNERKFFNTRLSSLCRIFAALDRLIDARVIRTDHLNRSNGPAIAIIPLDRSKRRRLDPMSLSKAHREEKILKKQIKSDGMALLDRTKAKITWDLYNIIYKRRSQRMRADGTQTPLDSYAPIKGPWSLTNSKDLLIGRAFRDWELQNSSDMYRNPCPPEIKKFILHKKNKRTFFKFVSEPGADISLKTLLEIVAGSGGDLSIEIRRKHPGRHWRNGGYNDAIGTNTV